MKKYEFQEMVNLVAYKNNLNLKDWELECIANFLPLERCELLLEDLKSVKIMTRNGGY